jgi:predicted dehydrogenase
MVAVLPQRQSQAANERVRLGLMGCGGRGTGVAQMFAGRSDAQIVYVCDPDNRRSARTKQTIEKIQGKPTQVVQDFRRMLDDKNVDALINATPDHWHALGTIMACQAGKDVYTEKPLAHNIWEGRKMIEAARKYKRVVQVGTQSRNGLTDE